MEPKAVASTPLLNKLTNIEQELDGVVDHGSDEDLFIASYLQGHYAVIARQLEMDPSATLESLDKAMRESLSLAFSKAELEQQDQQKVLAMWVRLFASR